MIWQPVLTVAQIQNINHSLECLTKAECTIEANEGLYWSVTCCILLSPNSSPCWKKTSSRNFMTNIRIDHSNWDHLKLLCFLKSVYNYLPNIFIVVCSPRQKRHHPKESDFFGCTMYKIIESNNYRIDRQVRKLNEYHDWPLQKHRQWGPSDVSTSFMI